MNSGEVLRTDVFPSVVCVVTDPGPTLTQKIDQLANEMASRYRYYEIILVDNASRDGSAARIAKVLDRHKNIQVYVLSARAAESAAIAAGLHRAIGDRIVLLDLMTDPAEAIPEMINMLHDGTEIVYGLPSGREQGGRFYDRLARYFLRSVARFNGVTAPAAMSTCRAFTRDVLTYILGSENYHRTLPLAPAFSGYPFKTFTYERDEVAYRQRRSGLRAVFKALDLVFSSSVKPLRLVTILAVGMSFLSVLYAAYVLAAKLLMNDIAEGWTSLSLQVSISFFVISVVIAIMCEYLLQVLETTNRRPVFNIAREAHSTVMDYDRGPNVQMAEEQPTSEKVSGEPS
ncbi:glycosyltransferase [Parvularcula lutaonensis]|uniref:Glycosyltransferase n=1 Tax=Parvularcula lutaonensis TaxID=491923 RepID=A0ABV7ME84_9PROT|nr:glycosyltransferase [Parvularcula lutaonensis]GGY49437.1 glycosyl transferase family 2 [Parvularcula lutaonensis]